MQGIHNLGRDDLVKIVEIQADRLRKMLADRHIGLILTEPAKEYIANEGYDPAYGARPIKRTLQQIVADPLALAILEGKFSDGDTVEIGLNGNGLVFEKAG